MTAPISTHKKRLRRVQQDLKSDSQNAALVLSAAPHRIRSRDNHYTYRQSSDFYYLTGLTGKGICLVVTAQSATLYVPPVDPVLVVWEGSPPDYKKQSSVLGVELKIEKNIPAAVNRMLSTVDTLYFQNDADSLGWNIARTRLEAQSAFRRSGPQRFLHADLLLEPLRLIKDKEEVALISDAIAISYEALKGIAPLVTAGTSEHQLANALAYRMGLYGATPAFATIAASGKGAATLHYEHLESHLKKNDLFLLDYGAEHNMYAADITRAFPVSGTFSSWQRDLYDIVLASQLAAIKKIKAGVTIQTVYNAAARVLTRGLVDLKVLKGNPTDLFKKAAYREFFPHGIGHSLGLDVHDIGNIRGGTDARLEAGMIITVEPGLYFPKKTGTLPACGIRIEDDILVTASGAKNLSAAIPKTTNDVESFLATYG
jgi:Xaa-Pro aminopeptidase